MQAVEYLLWQDILKSDLWIPFNLVPLILGKKKTHEFEITYFKLSNLNLNCLVRLLKNYNNVAYVLPLGNNVDILLL